MCLADVPAEYQTVTRQGVKTPADVRDGGIPAEGFGRFFRKRGRLAFAPAQTPILATPPPQAGEVGRGKEVASLRQRSVRGGHAPLVSRG